MFGVLEKENLLLKECLLAKRLGKKIFIYGASLSAKMVLNVLKRHGIPLEGFCVDAQFYKKGMYKEGLPIMLVDKLVVESNRGEDIAIIVAFTVEKKLDFRRYGHIQIIDRDFWLFGTAYNYIGNEIDFDFWEKNRDRFETLYDALEDEKSKACMLAYINQKISGDFRYLESLYGSNQYYEKELVDIGNVRCMVDCGTYDGDSFRIFCQNYEKVVGRQYNETAVLLEPSKEAYDKLKSLNIADKKKLIIENYGVWESEGCLYFSEDGTSSRIEKRGTDMARVNKLDNIAYEIFRENNFKAGEGFIKMDIEGSELNALRGGSNLVQKYHPILAVCVYHKKEDLITIPAYIKSLYEEYRFFLRIYSRYAKELVLYAIPNT